MMVLFIASSGLSCSYSLLPYVFVLLSDVIQCQKVRVIKVIKVQKMFYTFWVLVNLSWGGPRLVWVLWTAGR